MKQLYFACDWEITPVKSDLVYHVFDSAENLGCDLSTQAMRKTGEGLFTATFIISVPSREKLEEFITRAGTSMGLTSWYPVPEEVYLQRTTIAKHHQKAGVVDTSRVFGEINVERKNQRSS